MSKNLTMKFDKNTIDHLGIKLYSSFPPVVAELISNSYDADSEIVLVDIDYKKKYVRVHDDGLGMTFNELDDEFLVVGRNRRVKNQSDLSPTKKRKVTGRKGVGKLAVFGIAKDIIVSSTKNNYCNSFKMNYQDIKECPTNEYSPKILKQDVPIDENEASGTTVIVENIKQQKITDIDTLSISLSKRFKFYDEDDFMVILKDVNSGKEIVMNNSIFFENLDKEFEWNFPEDFMNLAKTEFQNLIKYNATGKIFTKPTPLPKKDTGFIVYSRGKLVQENTFFSSRSNDHFNSYVTGYFDIDFIDNINEEDFISTDRKSVLWEQSEELSNIKRELNILINIIQNKWRKGRNEKKEKQLTESLPENFYSDIESEVDKQVLKGIEKNLITNSTAQDNVENTIDIMKSLKTQFKFESFKNRVAALNDVEVTVENMEKISQDWEDIETQELAKIAVGRIKTIERFEAFVNNNASERDVIQPFLEKFPWILEPRMTHFDREVTFSRILKKNFPDEKLIASNRRIDFLCSNINSDVFIIELKRPNIKISSDEILQALEYESFLRKKRSEIKSISTFLISDRFDMDDATSHLYETLKKDSFIIRSYTEMLDQAKNYHKQFMDAQMRVENTKRSK